MKKRIIIGAAVILGLFVILGALFWEKFPHQFGAMKSAPPPSQVEAITTAKATQQQWAPLLGSVGTLIAENGVTISAEIAGTITRIEFESGAKVEKDTLLAQCDVGVEEAQLKSAEARAELARLNVERVRELRTRGTLAQADLDTAEAQFTQATSDAKAITAAIEKKTFRAPFSGRLGIRAVNLGQYVNAGQAIVDLQRLDPIHVDFTLPQQRVADLAVGQEVRVTTDGVGGQVFVGHITALDPRVDPVTRAIRVRATFDNSAEKLRPGMFASVDVVLPVASSVVAIPSSAVLYAPYGNSVFVVERTTDAQGKEHTTVRQQTVRLGVTRGDLVAVVDGLKPGDEVASTGAFKLRNGAPVLVNNAIQIPISLEPKPANS